MDSSRDLNIAITKEPKIDPEEEYLTYMTRERTQHSQLLTGSHSQSEFERSTFVQLDTLRAGDVFVRIPLVFISKTNSNAVSRYLHYSKAVVNEIDILKTKE